MVLRHLAVAGLSSFLACAAAQAQDLRAPRELPPAGFTGQQYVDSGGCVFVRAGVAGRTTWVARVNAARRQVCGYPPSFAPAPAAVAEAPRPAQAPVAGAAVPAPAPASLAAAPAPPAPRPAAPRAAAPRAARAPAAAPAAAPAIPGISPAPRMARCPDHAPYGARVMTTDGGSALLCVATPDGVPAFARRIGLRDGRLAVAAAAADGEAGVGRAAAAPVVIAPAVRVAGVGPSLLADGRLACPAGVPVARRVALQGGGSTLICTGPEGRTATAVAAAAAPAVPSGYRLAWQDGRLNPQRGKGTAEGWAMQDRVWTREVPAELVADAGGSARAALSASGASAAGARLYVQVGSFREPANAAGAIARLAGLGLPVARGRGTIGGRAVEVIHAGPFATETQARAALAAARSAGFADAFLRR